MFKKTSPFEIVEERTFCTVHSVRFCEHHWTRLADHKSWFVSERENSGVCAVEECALKVHVVCLRSYTHQFLYRQDD